MRLLRNRSRPSVLARLAVLVAILSVAMLVGAASASASISNPLTGISPDPGLFGDALNAAWKRVAAAIWGAVILGSTVRVIVGAYKVRRAKNRGYSNDLAEGAEDLQDALASLGLVGLASPIVGAILFVAGG
ncbi:hypothetical protein ACFXG4_30405 [Nocardia sp. NPDC059246]|uniref:hypothetical protein n=1 Tax=unclassified Nocardia TaxID=2637762 RepID=UPI003681A8CC